MCHAMKKTVLTTLLAVALSAPLAVGQELPAPASESPTRTVAPNTDACPHALRPEEPVTTSERLAPGESAPEPLPAVDSGEFCGVSAPAGFELNPAVVASAWMVSDIDTGEIVAMKDPNGRYRPASIIKALLALVAIEELDLNSKVEVSQESADADGSAVGIGPGGDYTVEQLLDGLLLASGNDAAHALAQRLGGDEAALAKVNDLAKQLGTRSTHASSYSGLDAAGMSTSAEDISLIYQAAFSNPTFSRIVRTEHVDFPGWGDMPGYELWNDNHLYLNDPDGIGGKTGFTDDAHHTFVGALDRDGRRLQAVVLDTTVEHGYRAWQQAQMLLNEAYKVQPGDGVSKLQAQVPTATPTPPSAPAPTPTPTVQATAESSVGGIESWVGWAVATIVALMVTMGAAFSLLRR